VHAHELIFANTYQVGEKQDVQCTYSIMLRRVVPTFVTVEKQKVLHILNVCF